MSGLSGLGTAAACVLAGVLAWAGLAKVRLPRGTAASFEALGVPLPRTAARLVPVVELAAAGLLVWRPRAGAVVALLLLVLFTAVLARVVRSGRQVACACFGTVASRPVSVVELARNAGLGGLAVVAVAVPAGPVVPALPEVVVVTVAVLLGTVALAALELRGVIGRLWDNRLAGEAVR